MAHRIATKFSPMPVPSSQMSRLPRLEREPLHERVYAEIRKAIMAAEFTPEQRLPIRSLARALGTSPTPVRAALSRLVAERALTLLPSGSVIVPSMTRSRFLDLTELRVTIEGMVTERAAGTIAEEELDKISALHEDLVLAAEKKDARRYLQKHGEFKFAIYGGAHSETYLSLIETLWIQYGPFRCYYSKDMQLQIEIGRLDKVLESLRRRDGRAARATIERDITQGAKYLLSVAKFAPEETSSVVGSF